MVIIATLLTERSGIETGTVLTKTAKGRRRLPWSADSLTKVIAGVEQVLADAKAQGIIGRNVAELVNRVKKPHKPIDSYTEAEVQKLLTAIGDDRMSHVWELALSGLRRGEIAGLRWSEIDLEAKTSSVANNRVDAGGRAVENDPKSASSRRTLPLPDRLVTVLRSAKARQARERLTLGADGSLWEYAVSNEAGQPYHPQVLSRYWAETVKSAGVRHIKLHAARHTCASLKPYAHSQDEALKAAGATLDRVVREL